MKKNPSWAQRDSFFRGIVVQVIAMEIRQKLCCKIKSVTLAGNGVMRAVVAGYTSRTESKHSRLTRTRVTAAALGTDWHNTLVP